MLGFIRKLFPLALDMDVREGDETEPVRPAWAWRVDALGAEIARLRREIAAQRSDLEARGVGSARRSRPAASASRCSGAELETTR